jgi:hypothetical protein
MFSVVLLAASGCAPSQRQPADSATLDQVRAQIIPKEGQSMAYGLALSLENTQQLIDFYDSMALTAEQKQVKRDALSTLKAPCCDDNTMYDC